MACDFKQQRRVEFVETDMAGMVHFSNFFRYMEATEVAFFQALNIPSILTDKGSFFGWPRLEARCQYHSPLRFQDTVEVHLFIKDIQEKALCFYFHIGKVEGEDAPLAATGEYTTLYASLDTKTQAIQATPIPPIILSKLEPASPEQWRPEKV